jgi:phage baseplate assembly protein W
MTFSSDINLYEDFVKANNTVFDERAIQNSIKNILLTRIGSMPGKPEFGSRIMEIPFNLNDQVTKILLKQVIEEALRKWEFRITFKDVEVISHEVNSLTAKIIYKYKDSQLNGSLNIEVNI